MKLCGWSEGAKGRRKYNRLAALGIAFREKRGHNSYSGLILGCKFLCIYLKELMTRSQGPPRCEELKRSRVDR